MQDSPNFNIKKIYLGTEQHTCRNCANVFKGKVCNVCGEKVFNEKHLTVGHFFKQILDFFYHFESKVLKSIWLNIKKPGFITKQNLNGITVPYAKPIQLFLVVNLLFFLANTFVHVSDYKPSLGDHYYGGISSHRLLKWAEPLDNKIIEGIDKLQGNTFQKYYKKDSLYLSKNEDMVRIQSGFSAKEDSMLFANTNKSILSGYSSVKEVQAIFDNKMSGYSKTMVFLLVPLFGLVFFTIFFKQLKYYGAALILSTHFAVYNFCFFCLHVIIDWLPRRLGYHGKQILSYPIETIFYNKYTDPASTFLFGTSFEMLHFIFWFPWLFLAFKHLWQLSWWKNILVSYLCSRVFFFIVFTLYKKLLIAFTLWMM